MGTIAKILPGRDAQIFQVSEAVKGRAGGHTLFVSRSQEQGCEGNVTPDIARINALEAELQQYRYMIEKMVRQRTVQLNRRVSLLRSCNSRLCGEFNKMRDKYLNLLDEINSCDAAEPVSIKMMHRPLLATRQIAGKKQHATRSSDLLAQNDPCHIIPVATWIVIQQENEAQYESVLSSDS